MNVSLTVSIQGEGIARFNGPPPKAKKPAKKTKKGPNSANSSSEPKAKRLVGEYTTNHHLFKAKTLTSTSLIVSSKVFGNLRVLENVFSNSKAGSP